MNLGVEAFEPPGPDLTLLAQLFRLIFGNMTRAVK